MDTIRHASDYFDSLMDLGDPRANNLLLMQTPWTVISLSLGYLYAVYVYLPKYMANRKAYSLKTFLAFYNIFQVVINAIIVYGLVTSGWTTYYSLTCQPVDRSENEMALRVVNILWLTMMIKLVDFLETFAFILRKKDNQVTVLHVFHHVSTFILGWGGLKYNPGGMYTFPVILNSSVHVLMYTYYYLASLGPGMQKRVNFIKSKLTTIQIVQLISIVIQQTHGLTCKDAHMVWPITGILVVIIDVILFLNFYRQSYSKKIKRS